MTQKEILKLLEQVKKHRLPIEKAAAQLKAFSVEDLGFAKVDHHREKRKGMPEVIYCQGKTPDQIKGIARAIINHGSILLGTRLSQESYNKIGSDIPEASYDPISRTITFIPKKKKRPGTGNIAIICAGTSDIPVAEEAAITASVFGNRVVRIYDAGLQGYTGFLVKAIKSQRHA